MKKKTTMTVTDIRSLAEGICSMTLRYPEGEAPEELLSALKEQVEGNID